MAEELLLKKDLIKAIDDAAETLTKDRIKEIEEEISNCEFKTIISVDDSLKKLLETDMEIRNCEFKTIISVEDCLKKLLETDMEIGEVFNHASKILNQIQLGNIIMIVFLTLKLQQFVIIHVFSRLGCRFKIYGTVHALESKNFQFVWKN